MTAHGIRVSLSGLVLVLGVSLSSTAWAADAELFAGLIPGTPLTDEELEQYHGRGLNLASAITSLIEEATSIAEVVRERVDEILKESRVDFVHEFEQEWSATDIDAFERPADSARARMDAIRAHIAEVKARAHSGF
jgi:hypothetical protein